MGFRIDLTPTQARTRLRPRCSCSALRLERRRGDGQAALEELLAHHRYGRSGLALVPQGTPTNNTEDAGAGYTRRDDPDASFDDRTRRAAVHADEPIRRTKRDGQWLAEALGIDPTLFAARPRSRRRATRRERGR